MICAHPLICAQPGGRLHQFQGWCAKAFKDKNMSIFLVIALVVSICLVAMTWTIGPIAKVGVVSCFNVAIVFFIYWPRRFMALPGHDGENQMLTKDAKRAIRRDALPIITAAITGHRTTKEMARSLPVLLHEQVEASVQAVAAGASIIHLHVCEEDDKEVISTVCASRYHEVIKAIREKLPNVVIEITCRGVDESCNLPETVERGNLVFLDPAMWGHDESLKPEIVALNVSTRNIDERTVIVNPIYHVEQQIQNVYELGCTPRCDVYDVGDILVTKRLIAKGVLKSPVHYLLILGSYSGIGTEKRDLEYMVQQLPPDAIWTALGTGRYNFPIAEYAVELGGHLRTGFEDCTYISKGVKAKDNAELVTKLASICDAANARPASLSDARAIMGFPIDKNCTSSHVSGAPGSHGSSYFR
jgi:3-keto-5-aminohexanoate cleavage enzyme